MDVNGVDADYVGQPYSQDRESLGRDELVNVDGESGGFLTILQHVVSAAAEHYRSHFGVSVHRGDLRFYFAGIDGSFIRYLAPAK